MNANLQPNNELDQTTPVNNEVPQTTDVTQETDSQVLAEETNLDAEAANEACDDTGADSATSAETASDDSPAEEVAPTEPQDSDTVDTVAADETVLEATSLVATDSVEPSASADPAGTDATPATELELTAERPALTEEDQEYYGFAVTGSPDDGTPTTPLWERINSVTSPAERSKIKRAATVALVCAVALVSFIAGGLASRMSSQMPILFGHGEDTQSVASYTPHVTQRDAEDDADPSATTTTNQQADPRDTDAWTKDTDEGKNADKGKNKYTTPTDEDSTSDSKNKTPRGKDSDKDDYSDDYTNKWYFNNDGDESISYDSDKNTYTIDYDGYTLTVPTDEFFDDEMLERWYSPYGDSDMYDYYYDYGYGYGDETGYDTEEDRGRRSWGGQSDEGTSYNWDDSEGQNGSKDWGNSYDYPFFGWDEYSA